MGRRDAKRQRRGRIAATGFRGSGTQPVGDDVPGRATHGNVTRPRVSRQARQAQHRRRPRLLFGCLTLVALFAGVLVAVGVVYVDRINDNLQSHFRSDGVANAALDQPAEEVRDEPFYMVIMGVDSREEGEDARSDTLMFARIDPERQHVTLVSIPRDTRTRIPGHGTQKINAARALGGPALVIETVRDITGLPISHYVEVDFQGFKDVVDALGGVTVDVPEDIYDMKAANHVESAARLEAGRQKLDGTHALTFVRSRAFPMGDLQRVENQQLFLRALTAEALKRENVLRLPAVVSAMSKSVMTDMSVGELLSLANQMKGMTDDDLDTVTMPGEPQTIGGASYVITDEEAFEAMIARIAQGLPAEEETAEDGRPLPASVSVTVRNGAGVTGVAADGARRLRRAGFEIEEVGNMQEFDHSQTLVVHKDEKGKAEIVSEALGVGQVVTSRGRYAFAGDVLLVIGSDWGPPQRLNTHQIPE